MFYKLLAADLCHNDVTYQEGLNVDPVPFDPSGDCKPGGLYYTDFEHIPRWYFDKWPLIADVTLPDNARVYAEPCGTKWKADQLVLSNIRPLSEFLATLDEATLSQMLAQEGNILECVKNQNEAMCLVAVRQNPYALEYVQNQTEAICLAAVQQDGSAVVHVRDQTDAICLAAIQQNVYALMYVRNQTEALCLVAVQKYVGALLFMDNQTDAVCLAAVQKTGTTLRFVRNQTDALCMAAVQQDGLALKHVRNQTEAICRAAVQQFPDAKGYVKIPITFYFNVYQCWPQAHLNGPPSQTPPTPDR